MALTFTPDTIDVNTAAKSTIVGAQKKVSGLVTFDSSYSTGGEAYTAATFGLDILDTVEVAGVSVAGTRLVSNDHANSKLLLWTALTTQAGNGTDQSAITVRATAYGK